MTNLDDHDDMRFVVHSVDDSVRALADSVALLVSGELLAPRRTRILDKALDPRNDPDTGAARLDGLELFGRGRVDEDAIACHAAEEP
jgi:hypothetical protein